MDLLLYVRVLRRYWALLLIGVLTAAACGLLAGFRVSGGGLESRVEPTYRSSQTLLLGAPGLGVFEAESAPRAVRLGTEQVRQSLPELALIYAYLVAGDELEALVEARVGPLRTGEQITALRRTTQPSGDESFPGRSSLPIIEVITTSRSAERADALARTAAEQFRADIATSQVEQEVPPQRRVTLTPLRSQDAVKTSSDSPVLPVVLVSGAVLVAFIALVFVLQNIANSPSRRREEQDAAPSVSPVPDEAQHVGAPAPVLHAAVTPAQERVLVPVMNGAGPGGPATIGHAPSAGLPTGWPVGDQVAPEQQDGGALRPGSGSSGPA